MQLCAQNSTEECWRVRAEAPLRAAEECHCVCRTVRRAVGTCVRAEAPLRAAEECNCVCRTVRRAVGTCVRAEAPLRAAEECNCVCRTVRRAVGTCVREHLCEHANCHGGESGCVASYHSRPH